MQTMKLINIFFPTEECGIMDQFFMAAVSLQVGLQPIATKKWGVQGQKGQVLLAENLIKLCLCSLQLPTEIWEDFDVMESAKLAAVPALVYALSGMLKLKGYSNCDGLTFNTINQTKILFSAICAYFLLGKIQTTTQLTSLAMATCAAILISLPTTKKSKSESKFVSGILPTIIASALSGAAACLAQYALQSKSRNSLLFTLELSLWGFLFALPTLTPSKFKGWSLMSFIPPLMQAVGGICVGIVIKTSGGVAYGFCTILGILIAAIAESIINGALPPVMHMLSVPVVISSIILYNQK